MPDVELLLSAAVKFGWEFSHYSDTAGVHYQVRLPNGEQATGETWTEALGRAFELQFATPPPPRTVSDLVGGGTGLVGEPGER